MKTQWELGALVTAACFSTAWGFTTFSDCYPEWFSDGMCDSSNNNSGCEYDGGDCCSCDCFDDTYECGTDGFTCLDPSSSCTLLVASSVSVPLLCFPTFAWTQPHDLGHGRDCYSPSMMPPMSTLGDDGAPVGVIVGGVVGGTAFLAAAAVLVCLFVTGRLKCSSCCSSSDPPAAPAPPAGHGSVQTTTKTFPGPVAPAPASDLPPPPAYGSSDHGATSTATSAPPGTHPVHQYPQLK
ncbi:unnamed protein product [Ectocarpus sp. 8 AP-2014]